MNADQIAAEAAGEHKHQDLILARNVPRSKAIIKTAIEKATKELQDPRIYTRCPACQCGTLHLIDKHLVCTWYQCPDPTLIERLAQSRTAHSFAEAAERKHAGEPLVAQGYLQGERASIAAPVTAHASVTTNTKAYEDGTITPAHASEQEKWTVNEYECLLILGPDQEIHATFGFEGKDLQKLRAIRDAHNATQQSADTKRREWIEHVRPTITFDINGCEIFGLSGNFCIGKGKTFIEAIDDAMSQTKEKE